MCIRRVAALDFNPEAWTTISGTGDIVGHVITPTKSGVLARLFSSLPSAVGR